MASLEGMAICTGFAESCFSFFIDLRNYTRAMRTSASQSHSGPGKPCNNSATHLHGCLVQSAPAAQPVAGIEAAVSINLRRLSGRGAQQEAVEAGRMGALERASQVGGAGSTREASERWKVRGGVSRSRTLTWWHKDKGCTMDVARKEDVWKMGLNMQERSCRLVACAVRSNKNRSCCAASSNGQASMFDAQSRMHLIPVLLQIKTT